MYNAKDVFSTSQAAEICFLSQQTIIKCFDHGLLGGFRIPGSRFRRITRSALAQFMEKYGIPRDRLIDSRPRVLVLSIDRDFYQDLRHELAPYRALADWAPNLFEAGLLAGAHRPALVIIDLDMGEALLQGLNHGLMSKAGLNGAPLIVVSGPNCTAAGPTTYNAALGKQLVRERLPHLLRELL